MLSSPNYLPYIYAICSNILFIIAQLIAKLQTSLVSPMFIIYYRSLIMVLFNSLLIYLHNQQKRRKIKQLQEDLENTLSRILVEEEERKMVRIDIMDQKVFWIMVKRVVFASLSMTFFTMSLQNVELSIANALFQTGPIFAFFIDAIVVKIRILRIHLVLTALSFLGVVIILLGQGSKGSNESSIDESAQQTTINDQYITPSWIVYLLPLAAAITSACSMSYLHQLKQKVHPLLTVQYLMIGAMIVSGVLFNFQTSDQIIIPNPHSTFFTHIISPLFIISTIVMSLLVFLSQYCRVRSLYMLPASKVAPLHYLGIVLSILFDLLIFGYSIKWYQYMGMILACSGLFMKLLVESRQVQKYQKENYTKMVSF